MYKSKLLFIILLLGYSTISSATVGGGQSIEFLGYDIKAKKLYLLRHYEDGRGRLPQLYYYAFNKSTSNDKLIEVQSLYINPKTHKIDYDQDQIQFEKKLNIIKQRLSPLTELKDNSNKSDITKIIIQKKTIKQSPVWYDSSKKIPEYHFKYTAQNYRYKSKTQVAKTYDEKLNISQKYIIPHQNKMIIAVKYFGIPVETGYSKEDPVLLLPIQKQSTKSRTSTKH